MHVLYPPVCCISFHSNKQTHHIRNRYQRKRTRLFIADILKVLDKIGNIILSRSLLGLSSLSHVSIVQELTKTQLVNDTGHQLLKSYKSQLVSRPTLLLGLSEDSGGIVAGANPD